MQNQDIAPITITTLYVVYDNVAQDVFGSIIRAANDEVARRAFHDLLMMKDSPVAAHRGDYDLLKIANIDNDANVGLPANVPTIVAKGQDWLDANKETIS